jgi:hypothetical protein
LADRSTVVRRLAPVVLVVVAAAGIVLVVAGGGDGGADGSGEASGLAIEDTGADSVAELGGLALPDSTSDFLTARLDDDSQLDVTFTIAAESEEEFLQGSALADPVEDQRVILHSSPLWELNAEGTVRGSSDLAPTGVRRAVELVEEGGLVRVRLVITPA